MCVSGATSIRCGTRGIAPETVITRGATAHATSIRISTGGVSSRDTNRVSEAAVTAGNVEQEPQNAAPRYAHRKRRNFFILAINVSGASATATLPAARTRSSSARRA